MGTKNKLFEMPFMRMRSRQIVVLMLCVVALPAWCQRLISGRVISAADSSVMPFVYIINKSNGNGTMSDAEGRFNLAVTARDTVLAAYFGYFKLEVVAEDLLARPGQATLVLRPMPFALREVQVNAFRIKPHEREYMEDIIDRSRMRDIDAFSSPITALYMQFSREGKQIRKLARIFEQLLIDELVQKKLSRDILVKLTGDDKIDYDAFRRYCYHLDDFFIIGHEGAELYSKVMDCYRKYKSELRR
jgi:hypothetical protein